MKEVHAEITYKDKDGQSIHSDICPPDHNFEEADKKYKEFLHICLDEWLEEGNGSGYFYISEKRVLQEEMFEEWADYFIERNLELNS